MIYVYILDDIEAMNDYKVVFTSQSEVAKYSLHTLRRK